MRFFTYKDNTFFEKRNAILYYHKRLTNCTKNDSFNHCLNTNQSLNTNSLFMLNLFYIFTSLFINFLKFVAMKKITFILLALSLAFVGCEKKGNKRLDPNATILLRPAKGVQLRSSDNPEHLTALEIVQQTVTMIYNNFEIAEDGEIRRGFADAQRDYDIPALKMWGTDIIDQIGDYKTEFINSHDIVLVRGETFETEDTIAYIPNSVIKEARISIKAAYDAGDYDKVYKLFDTAFTFIPITGAEWRALKAAGEN